MWEMKECDQSSICLRKYNIAKLKTKSVYKRLLHVVGRLLTFQIACGFNTSILSFAGPFFLNRIVNWIQKPDNSIFGAWIYLFALFICAVLKAINDGQMYFTGRRVGLQIRAILVGEIYEKSLKRAMTAGGAASSKVSSTDKEEKEELEKNNNSNTDDNDDEDATETDKLLPNDSENQDKSASTAAADEDKKKKEVSSSTSSSDASQGKIVTLMSVDTESIRTFVSYLHDDIIRLPLSTILAFTGLLLLLGWSALAGLGTLLVMGPLTAYLSKRANDLQTELMESTDDRVNITNEVLQGIRIIKYFAWEPQFIEKILKFRNIELRKYFNLWIVWAAFGIVSYGGGVIVSFTTFAFYTGKVS